MPFSSVAFPSVIPQSSRFSAPPMYVPERALNALIEHPELRVLDVRLPEDIDQHPCALPRSVQISHLDIDAETEAALVICHKGLKLSQGAAAWLCSKGIAAGVVEGGICAWLDSGLPTLAQSCFTPNTYVVPDAVEGAYLSWALARCVGPRTRVLRVAEDQVAPICERFGARTISAEAFAECFALDWPAFEEIRLALPRYASILRHSRAPWDTFDTMLRSLTAGEQI
ncbi:rhodanese-like domain-containing protein [Roseobacteraceae bacterium S113]